MKKLFSFTGNICTGKTTITKILSGKYGISCYSIDQYRVRYNANDFHTEWEAWGKLKSDIIKEDQAILESSGLSENLTEIYNHFDTVAVILLKCNETTLIDRAKQRINNGYEIPFFLNKNKPVECQIFDMELRLRKIVYNYIYDTSYLSPDEIVEQISRDIFHKAGSRIAMP